MPNWGELESLILDQQLDFAGRLEGDQYFSDITVVVEDKDDISTMITNKLAELSAKGGKVGAGAIVQSPECDDEYPNVLFGPLNVTWEFLALENRELNKLSNGTSKRAFAIARRIHRIMKQYRSEGVIETLVPLSPCIVPVSLPGLVAYAVRFACQESDDTAYQKCMTPVIIPAGGNAGDEVTITCATEFAAIYYTTDGTHPHEGNGNLYAGPFNAPLEGSLIKAAAHRVDWVDSNVVAKLFPAFVLSGEDLRPGATEGNELGQKV